MKKNRTILIIGSILFFMLVAINVRAASYDIYVDKNYDGDEEGTSEKPYKTIKKAIEESASKGKKIYIKNGTYDEQFTLPKGTELYGQDQIKTIIEGKTSTSVIIMKDENLIKNLSVQYGSDAIIVEGKAEISNCIVKNASKIAINLIEGSNKVKVSGSKITGNGKGFYVQRGRNVTISGNEIINNSEEGIDLRDKISGTITENYITGNGEGGIEIIVGSSDVLIKNNQIKKNKASGIAAQFYSQASKTGKIEIKNNTINSNGAYGLVCKIPSGGNPSGNYWNESIELTDNNIERNKGKSISGSCKIIEAISNEEEKKNKTIESETALNQNAETELGEETKKDDEEALKIIEKEIHLDTLREGAFIEYGSLEKELIQNIEKIKNTGKINIFFFGNNYTKINSAKDTIEKIKEEKIILERATEEIGDDEISNSKKNSLELISLMNEKINSAEIFISKQEDKFSLFGWLLNIFQSKKLTIKN